MPWSDEFISGSVQKTWLLKEYKSHRENLLLDQERARLPESQEDTARYIEAKKYVEDVKGKIAALQKEMYALPEVIAYNSFVPSAGNPYQMAAEAVKRPYLMRIRAYRELNEYVRNCGIVDNYGATRGVAPKVPEKSGWSFVMKCPVTDCEGFVGTKWSCGLCKTKVCKECREQICEESHTCDENKVLSVKALVKEAKPCPKCAAMISKVDGCDQMWCTQCHVAFSWTTGREETTIHNPHFYEWKRRNGGLEAAGPVGGACMNPMNMLERIATYAWTYDWKTPERKLCHFARKVIEVYAHLQLPFQHEIQDIQVDSEERRRILRVRRLLKEIDDNAWKTFLQRDEKARNKTRQVSDIYTMFVQTCCDLLRPLYNPATDLTLSDVPEKTAILQQLQELTKYANEQLAVVRKRFNSKVVDIDCSV
jgi:hypothetical protein